MKRNLIPRIYRINGIVVIYWLGYELVIGGRSNE
ncbi:Protein of unknown function [Bacillus cereus]|nr:Protein of unknown function [Bacillus cereus]